MRRIPMSMVDWVKKLDGFLTLNDREILSHAGKVSHELAKQIAEREYDTFYQKRLETETMQDSDFEKTAKQIEGASKIKKSKKTSKPDNSI
jgi:hypothetical protein